MVFFIPVVYLFSMNSTENRQRLTEDSLSYLNFKKHHLSRFPSDSEIMIVNCYAVYNSLLDSRCNKDYSNPEIKARLVATGFCELDEEFLVLKGFKLEDNLTVFVSSPRKKK